MNGQVVVMVSLNLNQDVQGGKKNGWYEGWRFQCMEDDDKSTSSRSRVSSRSHMDVRLVGDKKDVNRTFCMQQNTGTQTRFWPKGKVLYMHILTTYETAMHNVTGMLQSFSAIQIG